MIKIDSQLIDTVAKIAQSSPRKRTIHRFHQEDGDLIQRMLNIGNPGTYCQPHKHENPDKREVFLLLTGRCYIVEYTDYGEIKDFVLLDRATGNIGVEIEPGTWHHHIVLEPNTAVYELKDGPYNPIDDKNFAKWAPKEGDENTSEYIDSVLKRIQSL